MIQLFKYLFIVSLTVWVTAIVWLFFTDFYQITFFNLIINFIGISTASIEGNFLQKNKNGISKYISIILLIYIFCSFLLCFNNTQMFNTLQIHLVCHLLFAPIAVTQLISNKKEKLQRFPVLGLIIGMLLIFLTYWIKMKDLSILLIFAYFTYIIIVLFYQKSNSSKLF